MYLCLKLHVRWMYARISDAFPVLPTICAVVVLTVSAACLMQATIAGGGVIPHIHKSLINKQNKKEL